MSIISIILLGLITSISFGQEPFKQDGKWGYKQDGKVVILPAFDYATHFNQNIAAVQQAGKWGYIKPNGDWLVKAQYDKVSSFKDGLGKAIKGGKEFFFNPQGEMVLSGYNITLSQRYNVTQIKSGDKVGAVLTSGVVVDPVYDNVSNTNGIIVGEKKNEAGKSKYDYYAPDGLIAVNQSLSGEKAAKGTCIQITISQDFDTTLLQSTLSKHFIDNSDQKRNYLIGYFHAEKGWVRQPQYIEVNFLKTKEFTTTINKKEVSQFGYVVAFRDITPVNQEGLEWGEFNINEGVYNSDFDLLDSKTLEPVVENLTEMAAKDTWATESPYYIRNQSLEGIVFHSGEIQPPVYTFVTEIGSTVAYGHPDKVELISSEGNELEVDSFDLLTEYKYDEGWDEDIVFQDLMLMETTSNYIKVYDQESSYLLDATTLKKVTPAFPKSYLVRPFLVEENSSVIPAFTYQDSDTTKMGTKGCFFKLFDYGTEPMFDDIISGWRLEELFVQLDGKQLLMDPDLPPVDWIKADTIIHFQHVFPGLNDVEEPIPDRPHTLSYLLRNGDQYGIATTRGFQTPVAYDSVTALDFPNDFIAVWKNGKCGVVNVKYKTILEPQFDELPVLFKSRHNTWVIPTEKYPNFHYLDLRGHQLISPNDTYKIDRQGKRAGVRIDGTEVWSVEPIYKSLDVLDELDGFYLAKGSNKRYGIINSFGDTIVPFRYKKINTDYGYENQYLFDRPEIVAAETKEGFLVYDLYKEKQVFDFPITEVVELKSISEVSLVKTKTGVGLVHISGEVLFDPHVDAITEMEVWYGKIFLVKQNEHYGLINSEGKLLLKPIYDQISDAVAEDYLLPSDDWFILLRDGKKGAFNAKTLEFIELVYDELSTTTIENMEDNTPFLVGKNNEGITVFSASGKSIFPEKMDRVVYQYSSVNKEINQYLLGKVNEQYWAKLWSSEKKAVKADLIVGNKCYYQEGGKVYECNLVTGKVTRTWKDHQFNLAIGMGSGYLFLEKGKYGLRDDAGKLKVEPLYTNLLLFGESALILLDDKSKWIDPTELKLRVEEE